MSETEPQQRFARVLAGEVRRPGSFSLRSLEVLRGFERRDAEAFENLCSVLVEFPEHSDIPPSVFTECVGNPNASDLASLGLSYEELTNLQDAGILKAQLDSFQNFHHFVWKSQVLVAGEAVAFR